MHLNFGRDGREVRERRRFKSEAMHLGAIRDEVFREMTPREAGDAGDQDATVRHAGYPAAMAAVVGAIGRRIVNVLPPPSLLTTSTEPPC